MVKKAHNSLSNKRMDALGESREKQDPAVLLNRLRVQTLGYQRHGTTLELNWLIAPTPNFEKEVKVVLSKLCGMIVEQCRGEGIESRSPTNLVST